MAWQATVIILYNAVIFDKTANLGATKSIFNYFLIWRVVYAKCDYFEDYFTPFKVVFRREEYGKLDKHFTQN